MTLVFKTRTHLVIMKKQSRRDKIGFDSFSQGQKLTPTCLLHSADAAGCKWLTFLFLPIKWKNDRFNTNKRRGGGRREEGGTGTGCGWQGAVTSVATGGGENATPGLVLDVNKRMMHQKVTEQKDGYYPAKEQGKIGSKSRKGLFLAVEEKYTRALLDIPFHQNILSFRYFLQNWILIADFGTTESAVQADALFDWDK